MQRLMLNEPTPVGDKPLFVLLLHHANDVGPFKKLCCDDISGMAAGAGGAGAKAWITAEQLFRRGASPLITAANKQDIH